VRNVTRGRFLICLNNCYKQNHILRTTYRAVRKTVNMTDKSHEGTCLRTIRTCVSHDLLRKARALRNSSEGFDGFLKMLSQVFPSLRRDGRSVYLELSDGQCHCPIVRLYPSLRFPSTWCSCSTERAQLFESASGKPVMAELEKSLLKGDDICKVRLTLAG